MVVFVQQMPQAPLSLYCSFRVSYRLSVKPLTHNPKQVRKRSRVAQIALTVRLSIFLRGRAGYVSGSAHPRVSSGRHTEGFLTDSRTTALA